MKLRHTVAGILSAAIMSAGVAGGAGAETIKVGVLVPSSGTFAESGKQFKEAMEVYIAQHGKTVNGHTIEFIYKDDGGINPQLGKSLAQELIVKDGVTYLAGILSTPNGLAIAPVVQEAKVPTVIFNSATSIVTTKSDYYVRTSFTIAQVAQPVGEYAAGKGGGKTAVVAVTDYAPGIDGFTAFQKGFESKGGKVIDVIRMPVQTTDFAPFMQRILDKKPDLVFVFIPAGPNSYAFMKAFADNGLYKAGIKLYGTGETDETSLQSLGDSALGVITAYHYSPDHDSALNKAFLAKREELFKGSVSNFAAAGAYDGTHLLYEMVKHAGTDREKALEFAKNFSWESIRGPLKMNPKERHVTQNVYLRRVVRDEKTGLLVNREFDVIKDVPDLGLAIK